MKIVTHPLYSLEAPEADLRPGDTLTLTDDKGPVLRLTLSADAAVMHLYALRADKSCTEMAS